MLRSLRPLLCFLLITAGLSGFAKSGNGLMDLRHLDLCNMPRTNLNGSWGFYGKRLLPPEQFSGGNLPKADEYNRMDVLWNDRRGDYVPEDNQGVATYHLRLLTDGSCRTLAFTVPDMYCSARLWANGKEVFSNGRVSDNPREYYPQWLPQTVIYEGHTDTIDLVLQIANYTHFRGGSSQLIMAGSVDYLMQHRESQLAFDIFLAGGLIMGGLFFLGLFLFDRRDTATLFFSLFCIAYSYRVVGTEMYFVHVLLPDLPFWLAIRLEYISLYLSLILFAWFLVDIFPQEASRPLIRLFTFFNSAVILFTALAPPAWFTRIFDPYLVILGLYMAYAFYVVFVALFRRREGALFACLSTVFVLMSFTLLVLDHLQVIPYQRFLVLLGYIGFFFGHSLVLSFRFGRNLERMYVSAQASEIAKSEFLSSISHELRTPLNAIQGMSELLMREKLSPSAREQATAIRQNAEVLGNQILDLISASDRMEDGNNLDEREMNLRNSLDSALKLVEHLRKPAVRFTLDISPDIPGHLVGDDLRLRKALQHLLANAFKFTDAGDVSLKIRLERQDGSTFWISFLVKDTGTGIGKSDLNKLFRAFSSLESGRSKHAEGLGLGLALVKRITDRWGGTLLVNSIPGEGSEFRITLPFQIPPSEPSLFHQEPDLVLDTDLKVLVVDDNAVNLKLMEMMFRQLGLSYYSASGGVEAINKIRKQHFDIILMDIQMPGMNGWETSRALMEQPGGRSVIIALTANDTEDDRMKSQQIGMNDFLAKPIKLEQLRRTLLKWQSLGKSLRPGAGQAPRNP